MITVCKDCPKRHQECHNTCEWYRAERRALDAENRNRRAESSKGIYCSTGWSFNKKR